MEVSRHARTPKPEEPVLELTLVDADTVADAENWLWPESGHANVGQYIRHHSSEARRRTWWITAAHERVGVVAIFCHQRLKVWATSIFICEDWRGFGIAPRVLTAVGVAARARNLNILATIRESNKESIRAFSKVTTASPHSYTSLSGADRIVVFNLEEASHQNGYHNAAMSEFLREDISVLLA